MNLGLLAINPKSTSKHTTPRYQKQVPVVERKRSVLTGPNSAKKTRFIPPLSIPLKNFEQFEDRSEPESMHVKFLTEQKEYSTPRSIQTFVMLNGIDSRHHDNAAIIQRAWRNYLSKRRMYFFLDFIMKLRRDRLRYAINLWHLAIPKPANIAKHNYKNVINFLYTKGLIHLTKNNIWVTKDNLYNVLNINHAMQSGFVLMQPKYNEVVIEKYQKAFRKKFIHKIFSNWFSVASERLVMSKTSIIAQELAKKRLVFGPMLWTFYFWQRWSRYKKTKMIAPTKAQLYIPEWSLFAAKKKSKHRLDQVAFKLHIRFIKTTVLTCLKAKMVHKMFSDKACEMARRRRDILLMRMAYRAFSAEVAKTHLMMNIKRRILKAWYQVIDFQIIAKMKGTVLIHRSFLQSLKSAFKKWHSIIIDDGIRNAYLHTKVTANTNLMLRTFFLLKGDFAHFSFISAFTEWKKIIQRKQNKRRFILWSLKKSKEAVIRRYLFDVFKENAMKQTKRINYLPFHKDGESSFLLYHSSDHNSSTAKVVQHRRLIKAKSKGSAGVQDMGLNYFPTTTDQTVAAYINLVDHDQCKDNWFQTSSSDEVRTFFYRLIILVTLKNKFTKNFNSSEEKIELLKAFKSDKLLYSVADIRGYRTHQDRADFRRQNTFQQRIQRNAVLLLAFDTHDAAVSLNKVTQKKFTINSNPKDYTKSGNGVIEDEIEDESIDHSPTLQKNRRKKNFSIRSGGRGENGVHPYLQAINKIKVNLDKNNRKYRRKPEEIFFHGESSTLKGIRPKPSTESLQINQQDNGLYDSYRPIKKNENINRLMGNRDFLLKELNSLQNDENADLYDNSDENKNREKEEELLRKQKQQSNMPPPLEEMPSIVQNKRVRITAEQELRDSLRQSNENLMKSSGNLLSKPKEEKDPNLMTDTDKQLKTISEELAPEITIDELGDHFINDAGYFDYSDDDRTAMLTNKYLRVLNLLIGNSSMKPKHPDFLGISQTSTLNTVSKQNEDLRMNISKILRKVQPSKLPRGGHLLSSSSSNASGIGATKTALSIKNKSLKNGEKPENDNSQKTVTFQVTGGTTRRYGGSSKKRGNLFEDPDQQFDKVISPDGTEYQKSVCPEFNNVAFHGTGVLTATPWKPSGELQKLYGHRKTQKKDQPGPLQSATIKVAGFEDIPNSEELVHKVDEYLKTSCQTVEDQEILIESLKESARLAKGNDKVAILRLIDALVHKILLKQIEIQPNDADEGQIKLVDTDGITGTTSSDDEYIKNSYRFGNKKIYNKYHCETRKFAAFGTESRNVEPPEIMERKLTFTKDLIEAISEAAKFTTSFRMKYYDNPANIKPFEGLTRSNSTFFEKKVRKILDFHLNNVQNVVFQEEEGSLTLSIGGITDRRPPEKIKPTVPETEVISEKKKKKKKDRKEQPSLEETGAVLGVIRSNEEEEHQQSKYMEVKSRARTQLLDGCITPEPSKKKIVKKPVILKRKPQTTKMTPTKPHQPPDFDNGNENEEEKIKKQPKRPKTAQLLQSIDHPAKLKWHRETDKIQITENDVDFFMFVTPFIMPPEILCDILDSQQIQNS